MTDWFWEYKDVGNRLILVADLERQSVDARRNLVMLAIYELLASPQADMTHP